MSEYLVEIRLPDISAARDADDRIQQLKNAVAAVVEKINSDIFPAHGGHMIRDCSGYGVKGHLDENQINLLVETSSEGAVAIGALAGVERCGNLEFMKFVESARIKAPRPA